MAGILRFIGVVNAAIWLGGAVYFTFVAGQLPFSDEMKALLGLQQPPFFTSFFTGAVAQLGIARYFSFHLACGFIAAAHLAAEAFFLRTPLRRSTLGIVLGILLISLLSGQWLAPKMSLLHRQRYALNYPPVARQQAGQSFRSWHRVSMTVNLLVLGAVALCFWRVQQPPEAPKIFPRPKLNG